MEREFNTILVTGGAGFIGSNFISYLLGDTKFTGTVINLDSLTYAGNPANLELVEKEYSPERYQLIKGDIRVKEDVDKVFEQYDVDAVVHFAAESHVDRSILGPQCFIETNVLGTLNLLQAAREKWCGRRDVIFHHISTDEVYGSLGEDGYFFEDTKYDPRSPYSASKAGSDHLVSAYFHTYGLPVTISNCSNNYGPYQFPEKLIPLMIDRMMNNEALPIYGDGKNIRDWLHVFDHNSAVWQIVKQGAAGEVYNIGGESELTNIDLVLKLCSVLADLTGKCSEDFEKLITYVKDRLGHDRRYAINCDKIKESLGWQRRYSFDEGIKQTVKWYLDNRSWTDNVKSGSYRNWLDKNYSKR